MITAVDTSVLLDVFKKHPQFGPSSALALKQSEAHGAVIACDVVWAEVTAAFADQAAAAAALSTLGIAFVPLTQSDAERAGQAWRDYRIAGGTRERTTGDFLIAAHALDRADRLLTRDRGFYRRYFDGLQVVDPSEQ